MKNRFRLASALTAAAATVLLAFGASAGAGGGKTIKLGDDFFKPDKTSVSAGTKVKFKWTGNHSHNVTKKKGPGGGFASETTSRDGVNFTKKFKKSGTYKLICTVHPDTMKLKLTVG